MIEINLLKVLVFLSSLIYFVAQPCAEGGRVDTVMHNRGWKAVSKWPFDSGQLDMHQTLLAVSHKRPLRASLTLDGIGTKQSVPRGLTSHTSEAPSIELPEGHG